MKLEVAASTTSSAISNTAQMAGTSHDGVERTSRVDLHHGVARFAWQMVLADGRRLPEGLDIAHLSTDGTRIASIVGFFGALKAR